jgi:ketosteroid isomerase-like protein
MTGPKLSTAASVLLSLAITSGIVLPAAAQGSRPRSQSSEQMPSPTELDNLRMAATNLNAQRGELFRKKDLAGIGALYTSDATYIELLPRFEVMHGRAQIQAHFKDIMAANVTDLVPTITSAEMMSNGVMLAGGDFSLMVKGGKKISGHFFQILRQEGGTWKIATHAFARPEPVTSVEASEYNNGG